MKITLADTLTAKEMEKHWPQVLDCFRKYCARFPDEETVENMAFEVMTGKRQLWLVQDDTGKVILTPITENVTINATGKQYLLYAEIGGENVIEALPLIHEIEKWAKEVHGITEFHFYGRKGYRKFLGDQGYREELVIFKKTL